MTDKEFDKFVKNQRYISREFIEKGYQFWFEDNEHVRSPFPKEIQETLRERSFRTFMEWTYELTEEEKEQMKDEELVEMFEVLLFNEATKLIGKDDTESLLTINYPFLPRPGDEVNDQKEGLSKVRSRSVEKKKDDKVYMTIALETVSEGTSWETEFELPA